MFVQYFNRIELPLPVVEARLDDIRASMEEWADVAYREGEQLRARVGPGVDGYAKTVNLTIGQPEIRSAGLVYPISWTASGPTALFPRLNADLILTHLGHDTTQMSIVGTYQPPLGPVGYVVDRILLKKVAEATIQDWLDRVSEALIEESSGSREAREDLGALTETAPDQ